mmetsp:Transcript_7604/g.21130  ORF Transcript_7604/g.21130 Transcript_7604/m.21130 type:complete len:367 (+) Transcript_7604:65-1165(+)
MTEEEPEEERPAYSDERSTTSSYGGGSAAWVGDVPREHPGYRLIKIRNRTNFFDARWWWMVDLKCHDDAPRQGATILVQRCMNKYRWDEMLARRILTGYKQFLTLKKELGDWETHKIIPCHLVDLMWQVHLGDLNGYLHDTILLCDRVVERSSEVMIHRKLKRKLERQTLEALKTRFGQFFDEPLWLNRVQPSRPSRWGASRAPLEHQDGIVQKGRGNNNNSSTSRRGMGHQMSRLLCITPQRMGCKDNSSRRSRRNNNNRRASSRRGVPPVIIEEGNHDESVTPELSPIEQAGDDSTRSTREGSPENPNHSGSSGGDSTPEGLLDPCQDDLLVSHDSIVSRESMVSRDSIVSHGSASVQSEFIEL